MVFWSLIAVIVLAVLGTVLAPLLRTRIGAGTRSSYDLRVYRAQLRELEADKARSVLDDAEFEAARLEVQRRMLRADAAQQTAGSTLPPAVAALGIALLVPAGALGLYAWLGQPGLPGQPLQARVPAPTAPAQTASRPSQANVEQMIAGLAARLKEDPNDFRGWMLLGRSYVVTKRYDKAIETYRHALTMPEAKSDPGVNSALGAALVLKADGVVGAEAKTLFEKALAGNGADVGARYYLAMAQAQAGQMRQAFDAWLAMVKTAPPNAPWIATVRSQLEQAAASLGLNLNDHLAAANSGGRPAIPKEQMGMIRGMVEGLAQKLEENPDDHEGWMRLGRSYLVLGEPSKSVAAYGKAATLKPEDLDTLLAFAGAARALEAKDASTVGKAAALYRRILKLDKDNAEALWFAGLDDSRNGAREQAAAKWRRLLEILPKDAPQYGAVKDRLDRLINSVTKN